MNGDQRRAFLQYLVGAVACLFIGWFKPRGSAEPTALPVQVPDGIVYATTGGPVRTPKLVEVKYLRDLKWDAANCILTPVYGSLLLPEGCVLPELEDEDGNPL